MKSMSKSKSLLELILVTDDFIALSKPSGMLSIPDRLQKDKINVLTLLKEQFDSVFTVHRLDKDTSGVMLFARTPEMHKELNQLFEDRKIIKIYHAIVEGTPANEEGTINAPIANDPQQSGKMRVFAKGKEAKTDYKVEDLYKGFSLVSARIHTGRTHQVRVHMSFLGHPIVADPLYGNRTELNIQDIKRGVKLGKFTDSVHPLISRTALHAYSLAFKHPYTGELIEVKSEHPKDIRATLNQLEKHKSRR